LHVLFGIPTIFEISRLHFNEFHALKIIMDQHPTKHQMNDESSTMDVLFLDYNQYRDDNESMCSLRSLVSTNNDSIILDDGEGSLCRRDVEYQTMDQSDDDSYRYRQYSIQPSISAEMAIIARSSPEIKALVEDHPGTPCLPHEINFEFCEQPGGSSEYVIPSSPEVHRAFVSPLPSMDHISDENCSQSHEMRKSSDAAKCNCQQSDPKLDDADELALYMQRQSLSPEIRSPPPHTSTGEYKENLSPPFSYEDKTPETSNRSSSAGSFTFRSALRKESRRHQSLSSETVSQKRRPSFHRRVSFNSLPSPSDIASPRAQHVPVSINSSKPTSGAPPGKSPLAMEFPLD
jgi:hypothetical protein